MKDETESSIDEAWRVLEHKIQVFQEHVKGFQADVEKKLTQEKE
jgi:hypothetical protein